MCLKLFSYKFYLVISFFFRSLNQTCRKLTNAGAWFLSRRVNHHSDRPQTLACFAVTSTNRRLWTNLQKKYVCLVNFTTSFRLFSIFKTKPWTRLWQKMLWSNNKTRKWDESRCMTWTDRLSGWQIQRLHHSVLLNTMDSAVT